MARRTSRRSAVGKTVSGRWLHLFSAIALFHTAAPASAQQTEPSRVLRLDPADQVAWVSKYLDVGMPTNDIFPALLVNKGALVLPLVEEKIEQVLRAPDPKECFSLKTVDPEVFIGRGRNQHCVRWKRRGAPSNR